MSPSKFGLHKLLHDAKEAEKHVVGSWLMLPGASLARMIARMGFDFVIVDTEHGNIADDEMHIAVGMIASQGVSPMVRIPAPVNWIVKRALDTGAHGILCPMVSSVKEARDLVSFAKFPAPRGQRSQPGTISGIRGVGSPFAPAAFGQTPREYTANANDNVLIAVQIETVEGLNNCEAIAKVDGVDMLFVGPNDLASSMGFVSSDQPEKPEIPEVQAAIARVLAAAKAATKYAGMFCMTAAEVEKRSKQGFHFMNLGADVVALTIWNGAELDKLSNLRPKKD